MYKLKGIEYNGDMALIEVIEDLKLRNDFQYFADEKKNLPKEMEALAQDLLELC